MVHVYTKIKKTLVNMVVFFNSSLFRIVSK